MADLARADFDACLDFLAGDLAVAARAPSSPSRARRRAGRRRGSGSAAGCSASGAGRVIRWFSVERRHDHLGGVGPRRRPTASRSARSKGPTPSGSRPGDRFVLDGRSLEFRRLEGSDRPRRGRPAASPTCPAGRATASRSRPSWPATSPRSATRPSRLARRRARRRSAPGSSRRTTSTPTRRPSLEALFAAQEQVSEVPPPGGLLVEESPQRRGPVYAFHAPLGRSACEALGRATAARLGRRFGRDLALTVADLGWSIRLPDEAHARAPTTCPPLLAPERFEDDVLEGLDRGELPARRFRHVAATALMVLRNPDGGRTRVGGLLWVSNRLYPLVKAACPDHPLLRETRREVLEDLLDAPSALAWLEARPAVRFRRAGRPLAVRRRLDRPGRRRSRCGSSRPPRRSGGSTPGWSARPRVDRMTSGPRTRLAGSPPEGAAVHLAERTAVIADVHLGYEWARASGGDCAPAALAGRDAGQARPRLRPRRIARLVVAGDLVESPQPCPRTARDVGASSPGSADRGVEPLVLRGTTTRRDGPPCPSSLEVAGWTIGHGHRPCPAGPCLFGHHHPALKADGLIAPCFLVGLANDRPARLLAQRGGAQRGDGRLPEDLRREPMRCVAGLGGELLDFGPLSELTMKLAGSRWEPARTRATAKGT